MKKIIAAILAATLANAYSRYEAPAAPKAYRPRYTHPRPAKPSYVRKP